MTLVEFIAPLKNGANRDKCLAILFYECNYDNRTVLSVAEIRLGLRAARVPKWAKINVADVLSKSGHLVDSSDSTAARRVWALTESGKKYVQNLLAIPSVTTELKNDTTTLASIAAKLTDQTVKEYVEESIKCLGVGALRAAVVFLWTGAIRVLQEKAIAMGISALNAAVLKHDPKARNVGKVEDFAYIKDAVTLLALQELGILDKGEKATLEEALNLRNRCGHPTKYRPGEKKASSFIEDVMGIVF
jgi:hypothetical protein